MRDSLRDLKYHDRIPLRQKFLRLLWDVIYMTLFRPTPRWALHGWRRMLLRIFGAQIGEGSKISPSCKIWAPWNLEVGNYTALGDNVDCYNVAKVTIGSKVAISQRSFICGASHEIDSLLRPLISRPITIGDHVWVASEVMLLPGINIGHGTVIAARSLVTKDMPCWFVCSGSPCRPVYKRIITKGPSLSTV